jgi:myo-inositol-1(or 4)-monophosphatase
MHEPPCPPKDLLRLAVEAATAAGALLLRRYDSGHSVRFKNYGEIVTDVDLEAESLIRRQIFSARADDGFLGEEDEPVRSRTGITWLVDPIDGTTNYVRKLPGFMVSIAATWQGATLAAAVHDPIHGTLYTAAQATGSFANGKALHVSSLNHLRDALIGTGFSIEADKRLAQARLLAKISPYVSDVRCSGVCAYDLCQVAAGGLDGYYESHLKPWDYAAGLLIAREAGADVREMQLNNNSDGLIVAAAPGISKQLYGHISVET